MIFNLRHEKGSEGENGSFFNAYDLEEGKMNSNILLHGVFYMLYR